MDLLTIIVLYAMNTTILCAGYYRSFVRRRVYSILWEALAAYQVLSFFQLNSYFSLFSSSRPCKGAVSYASFQFIIIRGMFCPGTGVFEDSGFAN